MFAKLENHLALLFSALFFFNMIPIKNSFEREMKNNDYHIYGFFLMCMPGRTGSGLIKKWINKDEEQRHWELLIQTTGF